MTERSSDSAPPSRLGRLVVPKDAVAVELCDVRGRVRRAELFLTTPDPESSGERLQDLLRTRAFVPARIHEGGESHFELVSPGHLFWIRTELLTGLEELDFEVEGSPDAVSARLRVELEDGSSLEGIVRYLLPVDSRRVGDYLRSLPDPLPLRTADHLYLVRAGRVIGVVPLEEVEG